MIKRLKNEDFLRPTAVAAGHFLEIDFQMEIGHSNLKNIALCG